MLHGMWDFTLPGNQSYGVAFYQPLTTEFGCHCPAMSACFLCYPHPHPRHHPPFLLVLILLLLIITLILFIILSILLTLGEPEHLADFQG